MTPYRRAFTSLIVLLIMAGAACQAAPPETPTVTSAGALGGQAETRSGDMLGTLPPAPPPTWTPLPPLAGAEGDDVLEPGADALADAPAVEDAADEPTAAPADESGSGDVWYVAGGLRVNIRACPAVNCRVVAYANPGDPITVLSTADDWHRLRLDDGTIAYVAAWVTRQDPPLR